MRLYRIGLLVCILASLVFSGVPSAGERQGPRISVQESRYDFGVLDQGVRAEHTFEIKNVGDELLEIRQIQPT